ncbi:MAG: glycerophosphodiester phosphodiesterase family protein, partial [Spirochaetota bacterium]|nr:glycerophosphodiester phosphodiesterase family protein [Spirochaetota bacterium]
PEVSGGTRIITPGLIRHLHSRGVAVQVWTVNDEADMRRLLDMGVDGIMTDDPRLLLNVVRT